MSPADLVLTPMGLRFLGRHIPCTIGRSGIAEQKREGDNQTPSGIHSIVGMLFRPDRIARPAPWARPICHRDVWSDDPSDPGYNNLLKAPHSYSHERLRRSDRLYDIVLLTDWNWPKAVPGRGSAIFIHRWRRPGYPTEGCVAMRADHLLWVARSVEPGTRLIVR